MKDDWVAVEDDWEPVYDRSVPEETNPVRKAYRATLRGVYSGMADFGGLPLDIPVAVANAALRSGSKQPTSLFYNPDPYQFEPQPGARGLKALFNQFPTGTGVPLTYQSSGLLPPEERPFAHGGEAFGGSLLAGALATPLTAASRTALAASPQKYALNELTAAGGSGLYGGVASGYMPDSPEARFAGEIVGGFHPLRLAAEAIGRGASATKGLVTAYSKAGREAAAAAAIQKHLVASGEDPQKIAALLREPSIANLTAGQKSGSPTLLALENTLIEDSAKFGRDMDMQTATSLRTLRESADALRKVGNPDALRASAKLRDAYFKELINARIEVARRQAERARASIGGDKQAASQKSVDILTEAHQQARNVEKEKWALVDREVKLAPDGILKAYGDLRETLLREERVQPIVEEFISRVRPRQEATGIIGPDGKPVMRTVTPQIDSGELLRFRSRMLDKARDARAARDFDLARQYDAMARGALADMEKIPGDAADNARAYSRAFNEAFTQTFAGDVLAPGARGGDRIPPEAALERAVGTGGTMGGVRTKQLQEAAAFSGFGAQMQSEQERFLRAAAAETMDQGVVDPKKLQSFISKNELILDRFPGLKQQLSNATTAQRAFQEVQAIGDVASSAIQKRAAFSQLLNYEDPSRYIEEALIGKRPAAKYMELVRLANREGTGAREGLKMHTLDYAMRKAERGGKFSFTAYENALKQNINGNSLLQLMEVHGVMSKAEVQRLNMLLSEAGKIEASLANRSRVDDLVQGPDMLYDFVVRTTGANIGGAAAVGGSTGAPLVAAQAGSRLARTLFEKVPSTRVRDVMAEAAKDPKFMAALLEKVKTPAQRKALERQINGFLLNAGLTYESEE